VGPRTILVVIVAMLTIVGYWRFALGAEERPGRV
jgi:hypothetical protein